MDQFKIVILAAGKGRRMNSNLPKVLLPLRGKPLLLHLLDSVAKSEITEPATIVVGIGKELVQAAAGNDYHYVHQKEQLGTGHAVASAETELRGKAKHIMVLYGDHPLLDARAINKIAETHLRGNVPITMATVTVSDFNDWRAGFFDFGRVIRDKSGKIAKIVEKKDATPEELNITEINPSYMCFDSEWLWERLKLLKSDNAQKEYYLTDLPGIAQKEWLEINSVEIEPEAALGANTKEQLQILEKILAERGGGKHP